METGRISVRFAEIRSQEGESYGDQKKFRAT